MRNFCYAAWMLKQVTKLEYRPANVPSYFSKTRSRVCVELSLYIQISGTRKDILFFICAWLCTYRDTGERRTLSKRPP